MRHAKWRNKLEITIIQLLFSDLYAQCSKNYKDYMGIRSNFPELYTGWEKNWRI